MRGVVLGDTEEVQRQGVPGGEDLGEVWVRAQLWKEMNDVLVRAIGHQARADSCYILVGVGLFILTEAAQPSSRISGVLLAVDLGFAPAGNHR